MVFSWGSPAGERQDAPCILGDEAGAEIDLVVIRGRERLGFELKRTSVPSVTPSMRSALADLKLQRIDVVHAGDETWQLAPRIRAVALTRLERDIGTR